MKLIDRVDDYANLVTFLPNKDKAIHRWFPFVEGFSSELVKLLLDECTELPNRCFDPFGGVGTTALTCQENGVECVTVEANPFIYDVAKAKLSASLYDSVEFSDLIKLIRTNLSAKVQQPSYPELESRTFFEDGGQTKWIYNRQVSDGIFDLTEEISKTCIGSLAPYHKLALLSVGAILVDVSNVFRNGKTLSYREGWKTSSISRTEVHRRFLARLENIILPDLMALDASTWKDNSNGNLHFGDSRVTNHGEKKFDLVITSPPYLNSRDYTDTYRLELWTLGYVSKFTAEREIRKRALTSHVQITLDSVDFPQIDELVKVIEHLESDEATLWNRNIPNMVRGYFKDIEGFLSNLKPSLTDNARLYINVSNSAYSNQIIEVDLIIAKIAEKLGYVCDEIRVARHIKTSSQQMDQIEKSKMRESIIVLRNIVKNRS